MKLRLNTSNRSQGYAISGTGSVITEAGIPVHILPKLASG
jgi:hypothetical protein